MTISCSFGCPFEGRVDPGVVAELAARFADRAEVVLADTIGVATPSAVRALVERARAAGFHGHNTRNTGYANCLAALEAGARVLDASVGGLGGCPFSPRATGNVATEDLVYLLEGEGVETGIDLDALVGVSRWLEEVLGRTLEGYVHRAGSWPPRGDELGVVPESRMVRQTTCGPPSGSSTARPASRRAARATRCERVFRGPISETTRGAAEPLADGGAASVA